MKKKIKKFDEMSENVHQIDSKMTITKAELLKLLQDNLRLIIEEKDEYKRIEIHFGDDYITGDDLY